MSTQPEVEKKPVSALVPNRRQLAEHGRQTHLVTVESAKDPAEFLRPEFWSLVSKDMQTGDHVELRDDGMTYWAEYLVIASDRTWAKLHLLRESKLSPVEERQISPEFRVEYKGPHKKWSAIRVSDATIVHEGEPDRGSANRWLEEYVRTIGAPLAKAA